MGASDNAEKEDSKKDDIDSKIKEDEKNKLSDSNILQYRIPRFNESKILGASYTKPVVGIFCTLCKKFETKTLSQHCTERRHYEKFALSVNSKRRKAKSKERSVLATGEDEVMVSPKRPKLSPSPDDKELRRQMEEEEGEITEE